MVAHVHCSEMEGQSGCLGKAVWPKLYRPTAAHSELYDMGNDYFYVCFRPAVWCPWEVHRSQSLQQEKGGDIHNHNSAVHLWCEVSYINNGRGNKSAALFESKNCICCFSSLCHCKGNCLNAKSAMTNGSVWNCFSPRAFPPLIKSCNFLYKP